MWKKLTNIYILWRGTCQHSSEKKQEKDNLGSSMMQLKDNEVHPVGGIRNTLVHLRYQPNSVSLYDQDMASNAIRQTHIQATFFQQDEGTSAEHNYLTTAYPAKQRITLGDLVSPLELRNTVSMTASCPWHPQPKSQDTSTSTFTAISPISRLAKPVSEIQRRERRTVSPVTHQHLTWHITRWSTLSSGTGRLYTYISLILLVLLLTPDTVTVKYTVDISVPLEEIRKKEFGNNQLETIE